MTAPTAPHDAFPLHSRLTVLDAQIVLRHEALLAALDRGDFGEAEDRQADRDALLDERHALTTGAKA